MENKDLDLTFRIDALTPDTVSMKRLAEYLAVLSKLFGQEESIRFKKQRKGSLCVDMSIPQDVSTQILQRIHKSATTASDHHKHFKQLNEMLRIDHSVGTIKAKGSKKTLLLVPGRNSIKEEPIKIKEDGTVQGVVIKVGGRDDTVPVTLENNAKEVIHCTTNRSIAKQLANNLFGNTVRVNGKGTWIRDYKGWTLDSFEISDFEILEDISLSQSINDLKNIDTELQSMPDPFGTLNKIRG